MQDPHFDSSYKKCEMNGQIEGGDEEIGDLAVVEERQGPTTQKTGETSYMCPRLDNNSPELTAF